MHASHAYACAGLFQGSVAWEALGEVPEHPDLVLPHRTAGAADTPVKAKFEEYCHFFTETDFFGTQIPEEMSGKHVLVQLQCRHDRIVSYENGQRLHDDLGRIALGTHEHVATEPKSVLGDDGHEIPAAEFMEVAGGHAWGFVRCPLLLPAAVLRGLARLEALHYDDA